MPFAVMSRARTMPTPATAMNGLWSDVEDLD